MFREMKASGRSRLRCSFPSLAALLAIVTASQALPQDLKEIRLRVDVGLVNAAFSVRDGNGTFVSGLTKDDLEVFEDGVRQRIEFFGKNSDLPLTLGLIEDFSGSQDKFVKKHRKDTQAFLRTVLRPSDKVFLVCFGNHVRLASDLTDSPSRIDRAIAAFDHDPRKFPFLGEDEKREGGTALFDAVFFASRNKMRSQMGRKAFIVMSDGEDNSSQRSLATAIEAAQGADALVYAIRYTELSHGRVTPINRQGIEAMRKLAEETGGRDFDASKTDVREAFNQIGEELRSLYELAYTSSNQTRDGSFRRIEIRARQKEFKVRARMGYFAR